MTASECVERLLDHGLADVDRAALHDVSRRVLEALPPGGSVLDVWWTPGRLEVFGTHTDYAGGRSLVCAVPRGMLLAARRRIDGRVVVTDAASGESVAIEPGCDPSTFSAWRRYVAVVVDRLSRNFPGAVRGCEIAFESTLARASGMSSSSALVIALASALVSLNDLAQQDAWTANIRSPIDAAGYYACIENGRTFGGLAGTSGVGTHGGSEDHAAILTGRRGIVTAFRFAPMTRLQDVAVPADWRFVIATSNVRAEKTGPAQASYNRLADEVQVLLDWWIACETPASSLADALRTDAAAADRERSSMRSLRCRPGRRSLPRTESLRGDSVRAPPHRAGERPHAVRGDTCSRSGARGRSCCGRRRSTHWARRGRSSPTARWSAAASRSDRCRGALRRRR